jgi:lactate dehydrogenase-like 2-hydroxyacid dehydrogenase
MSPFRVGITGDFAPGNLIGGWIDDPVRRLLEPLPGLEWEFIPASAPVITPETVANYDAVITAEPRWTAESFRDLRRPALVACWGIGVDGVDLGAAAEADIAVTNSPSPGNHASVAESALALVLSLSKHLLIKDQLTKQGRASDAQAILGTLIRGRTIGTIGFGATAWSVPLARHGCWRVTPTCRRGSPSRPASSLRTSGPSCSPPIMSW